MWKTVVRVEICFSSFYFGHNTQINDRFLFSKGFVDPTCENSEKIWKKGDPYWPLRIMLGSQRPRRAHKMDKLAYYFFMFLKKKFNSHSKKCVFLSLLPEEMKLKNKKKSFKFFCLYERDKIKHWQTTLLKKKLGQISRLVFHFS